MAVGCDGGFDGESRYRWYKIAACRGAKERRHGVRIRVWMCAQVCKHGGNTWRERGGRGGEGDVPGSSYMACGKTPKPVNPI